MGTQWQLKSEIIHMEGTLIECLGKKCTPDEIQNIIQKRDFLKYQLAFMERAEEKQDKTEDLCSRIIKVTRLLLNGVLALRY